MKYREMMWAEMKPDMYGGENCDKQVPMWSCFCEGDKDGEHSTADIVLGAETFPPGTRVVISLPTCPECDIERVCGPEGCEDNCHNCGFSWINWEMDTYS